MLIPPEVMGAHIGPTRAHTTGRVHTLAFRAATALFGHLGVEWNVARLDEDRRAELAQAIAVHKRFRPLLHSGDVVRFDTEAEFCAHGVYAHDRSEALVSFAQLTTSRSLTPPALRLPGLDPDGRYRLGTRRAPRRAMGHVGDAAGVADRGGRTHRPPARRPRHPPAGAASRVGRAVLARAALLIAGEARDAVSTVVGVTHGHRPEATT